MKYKAIVAFSVLTAATVHAQANDVRFLPRIKTQGIEHIYAGGWEHFVGGGMASFDCNGDQFTDVFLAGGENSSQLLINTTKAQGDQISFQIAENSNANFLGVTGAYPLDMDSDGLMDIFVMRVGENKIMRGLGQCVFEDVSQQWGFQADSQTAQRWTTSFAATWETGQQWPTLAVGNYVDRQNPDGPFGTCDVNELHRPVEGGPYGAYDTLAPGYCALSMLISDWQRSGQRDLRISNDRHYYLKAGSEQMYKLDENRFLGPDDGWKDVKLWGMGIASQDLNNDGKPDVMLTSMGDQLLQYYDGKGGFLSAPFSVGTYSHRPYFGDDGRPSTGWHAEFGDVNNDGLADLFIAKGNVDQMPGNAMADPNNLLIQQADGTFVEVGLEAGIGDTARSRGAALVDFNNDGQLDIAVMARRAPFEVYQNVSESDGNFVAIKLSQPEVNRDAIGAWVELRIAERTMTQEVTVGGGHASGELAPVHFGLGKVDGAQIRIIWPDGKASLWHEVEANQLVHVTKGDDGALKMSPLLID